MPHPRRLTSGASRLATAGALLAWTLASTGCSSPGGDGGGDVFWPGSDTIQIGDQIGSDSGPGGDATTGDTASGKCETAADCPPSSPHCAESGLCFACLTAGHCPEGQVCDGGACIPASCTAGESICNGNKQMTCKADGSGWDAFDCGGGTCVGGACTGCEAGKKVCSGLTVRQCKEDGSGFVEVETCSDEQKCLNGACVTCYPGALQCAGNFVQRCDANGVWKNEQDCNASGENCAVGKCVSACFSDPKYASNTGCDYWAVDMDNHYDANNGPFAVVIANLSDKASDVSIVTKDSMTAPSAQVAKKTVQPGTLEIFDLPQRNMAIPGLHWSAFRIQATAPIVAYQFNPLENVDVFSNDASLLIPANTFGTEYIAMSRFELLGGGPNDTAIPYRGAISVVASKENTTVSVTPTIKTQAGGGIQTMSPGQTYTYTLQPFQVLNIKSDQNGGDLTGTEITADKPVAVFSGHEAAVTSDRCCADHLEQQLFPLNTWGKTYIAAKSFPRGKEKDYWRIVASVDGTVVTFEPASVSGPKTLNRGEYFELATTADFRITATEPIMVGQILASSQEIVEPDPSLPCASNAQCPTGYECGMASDFTQRCFAPLCNGAGSSCPSGHVCAYYASAALWSCSPVGDPALILAAPIEQFRTEYVFLSPNKYLQDFVNIIAPSDAFVTLDGLAIPGGNWVAIPGTGYKVARLKVADGIHRVLADKEVGVIAYGYDKDVSYGYAAGLNLSDL